MGSWDLAALTENVDSYKLEFSFVAAEISVLVRGQKIHMMHTWRN